jgi:hypothetical protein
VKNLLRGNPPLQKERPRAHLYIDLEGQVCDVLALLVGVHLPHAGRRAALGNKAALHLAVGLHLVCRSVSKKGLSS